MRRLVLVLLAAVGIAFAAPPEYTLSTVPFAGGVRASDARLTLTGVHRPLSSEVREAGAWREQGADGPLWELAIRSLGARALRIEFRNFDVGEGKVWVHDGAGGERQGPYSGKGPFEDGSFWSGSVFGDRLVIEYQGPGPDQAVRFEIARLSHQLAEPANAGLIGTGDDGAGTCHVDATCKPEWAEAAKSVALILIETPEGQASCSGALVSTSSKTRVPYFLTADHCISDDSLARTVEAYWAYQSPTCGGKPPALRTVPRTPVGSRYLVSQPQIRADFSLILLPSLPPGVVFADWDPVDPLMRSELTGIHHPQGSYKRISVGTLTSNYWEMDYDEVPPQHYHQVLWNTGIVEPGSSGSPLFNASGKVVGVLSYGYQIGNYSWCDIKPSIAAYGRFSVAYGFLRSYLEDPSPTQLTVAPDRVSFKVDNRVVTPAVTQRLVARTMGGGTIQVASDSPWLSTRSVGGSWDLEIRPNLLSKPGLYTALVSVTADGVVRTVPVTADVTLRPSAVSVSASPNPVEAGDEDADGCRWAFKVTLEESAGVATGLTLVRFGSYDLTSEAERLFGSNSLDAKGKLEASLRYCGSPAVHALEFAGVDAPTKLAWRRSVLVEFR
ncbi:MAG: serine protease [Bryobacteraceae bacterium]|nr:serine protease [Bryobacteraceae bacterium]